MIYNKKKGIIRVLEVWYTDEESKRNCDVVRYKFVPAIPNNAYSIEELYTFLINLSLDTDTLLNEIAKNTKYEIKRARERDNLTVRTFLSAGQKDGNALQEYIHFFNGFADSKKRNGITTDELAQFYAAGNLEIRSVEDSETHEILSMHSYVISDGRARLFQSSSHFRDSSDPEFRKKTGRANRLLHWEDILYYKSKSLQYYDFGGWYGGSSDLEKLSINQFKEAFGGEKIREYSCIVPMTSLGKLSVLIRKIIRGK
jgi:lipid II:glycine glycyltransferase (peptidoglycan interpeptide bridge formation enzyme)